MNICEKHWSECCKVVYSFNDEIHGRTKKDRMKSWVSKKIGEEGKW